MSMLTHEGALPPAVDAEIAVPGSANNLFWMLPGPSAALCTGVAAGSTTQAQPVIPRACRAAIAAPISPTA